MDEGDSNLSRRRSTWIKGLSPMAQELVERDSRVFVHQALSTPCLTAITASKGSYITDVDGHQVLDFHGNNVHQIGYGHPRVLEAAWEQLHTLPFAPRRYTNEATIKLAERLRELSPMTNTRVLFVPGAAEAVSVAMKMARLVTGRFKTLSFYGAFHGSTLDALSVGGQPEFTRGLGPLLPGALHVEGFHPTMCRRGCHGECSGECMAQVDRILSAEDDVGLVLIEPIRNTDVEIPPSDFFYELKVICREHGALLAVDETATAWGRTGKMFAIEHFQIEPDIIIVGKGLGAGVYPLAATMLAGPWVVSPDQSIGHFTFEKSPVGSAVALAMLDVLEDEHLLSRARDLGEYFYQSLLSLKKKHPVIGAVRHIGLLLAVDIRDPQTDLAWGERADAILYLALERGLSFKVSSGSVLSLTPPLTVKREEIDRAVDILDSSMGSLEGTESLLGPSLSSKEGS